MDPSSLKRMDESLQYWSGAFSQIEAGPLFLDEDLFPSVSDFEEQGKVSIRGEAWWTHAELMTHTFYQKVLEPEELFFSMIAPLYDEKKHCIAYIVLWKKRQNGQFLDQDLNLFTGLLPEVGALLQKKPKNGTVVIKSKLDEEPLRPETNLFDPIEQLTGINEAELYSLIRRRAQPGILILDKRMKVIYLNLDAKVFLAGLTEKSRLAPQDEGISPSPQYEAGNEQMVLPEIICQLYEQFTEALILYESASEEPVPTVNRICIHVGVVYLLRALSLENQKNHKKQDHFMILIERVSQGLRIDQIDWTAKLTPRENEVVQLLLEGKTNKEVAVCINIGEYTVKDHIKRIMKKLEVTTRAGIVAKVLRHHFQS